MSQRHSDVLTAGWESSGSRGGRVHTFKNLNGRHHFPHHIPDPSLIYFTFTALFTKPPASWLPGFAWYYSTIPLFHWKMSHRLWIGTSGRNGLQRLFCTAADSPTALWIALLMNSSVIPPMLNKEVPIHTNAIWSLTPLSVWLTGHGSVSMVTRITDVMEDGVHRNRKRTWISLDLSVRYQIWMATGNISWVQEKIHL